MILAALGLHPLGSVAAQENAELKSDPAEGIATSESFQVVNEIYDAESNELLDRHRVLFHEGKIYDFALIAPRDVMVIDPVKQEVTLLSRKQQLKSTLPMEDMVNAAASMRMEAKQQGIEDKLGIEATAQKTDDGYVLEYDRYRYQCSSAAAATETQAKRFAEFTNWSARVNLIRRTGPPLFGRMTLAQAMAEDSVIPTTIKLHCQSEDVNRRFESRHQFQSELDPADEKSIEEVVGMISLYRAVSAKAFPR